MKKVITCFTFHVLLVMIGLGQTSLSGRLISLPNTTVRLVGDQSSLNDYIGKTYATAVSDGQGSFVLNFDLGEEKPLVLYAGQLFFKCWFVPGQPLTIIESSANGYRFEGTAASSNALLLKAGIMIPNQLSTSMQTAKFEPQLALRYLDSIENIRVKMFQEFSKSRLESKKFAEYYKAEVSSFTAFSKSQYPSKFLYMDKSIQQKDIPQGYFDFWKKFELTSDNCASDMYQNAVRDYISYKANVLLGDNAGRFDSLMKKTLEQSYLVLKNHPLTLQKQRAETILFLIRYLDLPSITSEAIYHYNIDYPKQESALLIEKEWTKKLANAQKKISFSLRDMAGNEINSESFKGKVVYIDFWGSWCKACLAQWPNTIQLQKAFAKDDLVFLFIDFYDTKEKWINALREKKIEGIHLKAEKSDEQYFNDVFGIANGFPRYAVLDRQGRLVTSSAPHPNDNSTEDFLKKILELK